MNTSATATAAATTPRGSSATSFDFLIQEMKPRGPWLTPFNVISIPVILTGVVIVIYRFIYGLGAVTNLSQEFPLGLLAGFRCGNGRCTCRRSLRPHLRRLCHASEKV